MKKFLALVLFCVLSNVFAEDVSMFRQFTNVVPPEPKLFTVSPSQILLRQVSEIVVHGENLQPINQWKIEGVKVLKQRFIDSRTVILTIFADGKTGLRSLGLRNSQPLSMEVLPSDILLSDDFEDGDISDWLQQKGVWVPASGQVETTAIRAAFMFPTIPDTDNVTIDFDVTLISGKYAGIYFQYRDKKNYRIVLLDGKKGIIRLKDRFNGGYETKLKFPLSGNVFGTQHHFSAAINNNHVSLTVDAVPIVDEDLGYIYTGQIGLYAKAATAQFDNVVVTKDPASNAVPMVDYTDSVVQKSVSFNAGASLDPDGNLIAYDWDFGDSTTGTGVTIDHDYSSSGNYVATLAITDNSGARTKIAKAISIQTPDTDKEAIQQVVRHFFELLADIEHLTGEQICVDFSHSPSCPAYDKQVNDLNDSKPDIEWFDVEFLSEVSVEFQSATDAYPVRIRNKLWAKYFGDPMLYYTDGWHIYDVRKESDGKWHQCSYSFELISTNDNHFRFMKLGFTM
jgi:PKD repeat protein